jgi:type IV secretory pathway VirB10-like protein
MTESSTRQLSSARHTLACVLLAGVSFAALFLGGCAARAKPRIPWSIAVLVRPVAPQRTSPTEEVPDISPDLGIETPRPPAPLPVARTGPARPRISAPTPAQTAPAGKLETPQIVPELSPQQASSLQRETKQSLTVAERNLAATAGKSLNATQTDLASKVRSFISDAQESGNSGDWARARELAKKAEVLSEELASAL